MSTFFENRGHDSDNDDDQRSLIVEVGDQLPSDLRLAPALNELPFAPTLNDLPFVPQGDPIYCTTCEMYVNGPNQYRDHLLGKKHRKNYQFQHVPRRRVFLVVERTFDWNFNTA